MKFSEVGEALTGQPMFEMLLRGQELERQGRHILHMELGDPDFSAPNNIVDAVTRAMKDGITHYVDSRGLPQFRDAIRYTLKNDFRLDCDLGQVVVTPGANSGIYWVLRCLLNPGDEVLIPDPGFPSFRAAAKAASVKVIPINCDRSNNFSLDLTEVEAAITPRSKLLIVNSPSNPTGFAMSEKTLDSIYTIAEKHNLYVLSDDTYRRMTYETEFSPSITKYDDCKKRTILLSGLSKEYSLSGLRLGYLVGPEELMSKVTLYIQTVNSCVAPFIQMGGVEAFLGDQKIRKDNLQILKLARSNLLFLLSEKARLNSNLWISITFVKMTESDEEISAFKNEWEPIVNDIHISPQFEYRNGSADGSRRQRIAKVQISRNTGNIMFTDDNDRVPCRQLWTRIVVTSQGELVPCSQNIDAELSLGNIMHTSIHDAWTGDLMKSLRMQHLCGSYKTAPGLICKTCTDWDWSGKVDTRPKVES